MEEKLVNEVSESLNIHFNEKQGRHSREVISILNDDMRKLEFDIQRLDM